MFFVVGLVDFGCWSGKFLDAGLGALWALDSVVFGHWTGWSLIIGVGARRCSSGIGLGCPLCFLRAYASEFLICCMFLEH